MDYEVGEGSEDAFFDFDAAGLEVEGEFVRGDGGVGEGDY